MNRRSLFLALILTVLFIIALSLHSCIIQNTQPEDCEIIETNIIEINEGGSYDIVFHDANSHQYYINRGLESGLNLDSLNTKVLNKRVTLHLAKLFYGTSKHIAQLAIDDEIIFTEFSSSANVTED